MSQQINSNVYPKGGHTFKCTDGTTIAGANWPGVIARLRAYRKRNNLPPGNPQEEVIQQACERNPGLCTPDDGNYAATLKLATLKTRILAWFAALRARKQAQPLEFVLQAEANKRADVCLQCPHNKELTDSGCSSCKNTVKELRKVIIEGRPVDSRLAHRGCNVLGEELATSVWLQSINEGNSDLPSPCWRKKSP